MNLTEKARQFRVTMQLYAETFSDEQAVEVSDIYPNWQSRVQYKKGRYG